MSATIELLSETRSVDLVTLRAVARRAGVAAPSIYLHFADRDALLIGALSEANDRFADALLAADRRSGTDVWKRLRSVARAYLRFAVEQTGCYVVLFAGVLPANLLSPVSAPGAPLPSSFAVLFQLCEAVTGQRLDTPELQISKTQISKTQISTTEPAAPSAESLGVSCEGEALSLHHSRTTPAAAHRDAMALALRIWACLHGLVELRTAQPAFPWPSDEAAVRELELMVVAGLPRPRS